MTERLSGGDMLIRALRDEGVEYIFGYPGGAALHIYDAIFRQQEIEHILIGFPTLESIKNSSKWYQKLV